MTKPRSKIIIATDASCLKDDIKNGAGLTTCAFVVVIDGRVVKEKTEVLGKRTISEAEYYGIIRALEYAIKMKYEDVLILSDSEFAVKQINGIYKVKAENIFPLYHRCVELITPNVTIQHHKRDDVLAKLADSLAHNECEKAKAKADINEYETYIRPRII